MSFLGNKQRSFCVFEIASKYCISESFVDYDGYFISSKGFLPTVVDIMVIELNLLIPVHFSSLMPKMLMFTLAISCWTTSNLPWFHGPRMDSRFLCSITLYSIGLYFHHQSHPQLGAVFALALPLIPPELFLHWSPVAYWAPTDLGSSSFSVLSLHGK